jgi:hypothetical protein
MTALERAARAVAGKFAIDYDTATEEQKISAADIAHAVLMAVRDLPTEFIGKQRGQLYRTEFLDCDFTTMIDAILNEKDTTNDRGTDAAGEGADGG